VTPTEEARQLLALGFSYQAVAEVTGLHVAYVRKIRQRDSGGDRAWQAWRGKVPLYVREYRAKQNRNRKLARSAA